MITHFWQNAPHVIKLFSFSYGIHLKRNIHAVLENWLKEARCLLILVLEQFSQRKIKLRILTYRFLYHLGMVDLKSFCLSEYWADHSKKYQGGPSNLIGISVHNYQISIFKQVKVTTSQRATRFKRSCYRTKNSPTQLILKFYEAV